MKKKICVLFTPLCIYSVICWYMLVIQWGWCLRRYLCTWVTFILKHRNRNSPSIMNKFKPLFPLLICPAFIYANPQFQTRNVTVLTLWEIYVFLRAHSLSVYGCFIYRKMSLRHFIGTFWTLRSVTSGSGTCVGRRNKIIRNYYDTADFRKNVNATTPCIYV